MDEVKPEEVDVRDLLNAQTGKLEWPELQRHFAQGKLIKVIDELDLVEVAARIVADDKEAIASWTKSGMVSRAVDEDARRWEADRPLFWAVVAAPWVVIQEISGSNNSSTLQ